MSDDPLREMIKREIEACESHLAALESGNFKIGGVELAHDKTPDAIFWQRQVLAQHVAALEKLLPA